MKILHTVEFYEPAKGGSEEVVRQLSERLAARGHEVVVATSYDARRTWESLNGVEVRGFRVRGKAAVGIKGDVSGYRRFLIEAKPDVLMNYGAQVWPTDLAFDLLNRLGMKKVLAPLGYSGLRSRRFRRYFAELPAHLGKYDALVYTSENYQDKWFGDHFGVGDKAVVIPNGASEEEFCSDSPSFRERFGIETPLMLLTVSNHFRYKGHRRLISAFRSLGRDDTTLVIVGEKSIRWWSGCYPICFAHSLGNPHIKVVKGLDRSMVVTAYKDADLFVLASEVECAPLAVYESMAAGVAFVSTRCGNLIDNAAYGVVVEGPEDLSLAIGRLLDDPATRHRLGDAGRSAWLSSHTWDRIVDAYEELYRRLIVSR